MSEQDLERAFQLIREHDGIADFYGGQSEDEIAAADARLGFALPPTYRRFVAEHGAGEFGPADFLDVTGEDSLTLKVRAEGTAVSLPEPFVLVLVDDDGIYFALDTSQTGASGEAPMVVWIPGTPPPDETFDPIFEDFGAFLLDTVQQAIEFEAIED